MAVSTFGDNYWRDAATPRRRRRPPRGAGAARSLGGSFAPVSSQQIEAAPAVAPPDTMSNYPGPATYPDITPPATPAPSGGGFFNNILNAGAALGSAVTGAGAGLGRMFEGVELPSFDMPPAQQETPGYMQFPQPQSMTPGGYIMGQGAQRQQTLDDFLLGSYLTGPTNLANTLNASFGQYQQDVHRGRMLDILENALGGINGGSRGGGGVGGFRDVNSGQFAGGGQYGTSITAAPATSAQISEALAATRGPTTMPQTDLGITPDSVSQQLSDAGAAGNNASAVDLSRMLAETNAGLDRGVEVSRANQGLALQNYLAGLQADQSQYQNALRNPVISALLNAGLV